MESQPDHFSVTIIIPVLNEATTIDELLTLLVGSADGRLRQIIIVDGGSTDATVEIAMSKGATVLHANVKNRAAQMNLGAEQARSSFLYFLHADTLPPVTYLDDLHYIVRKGALAGCFRLKFRGGPWLLRLNAFFTRFKGMLFRGGDQSLFIKKSVFNALNGFDEHYVIMEEYDLIKRILQHHTFDIIPAAVQVSTRKYSKNSYVRVSKANSRAMRMFLKGDDPVSIAHFYKNYLK